MILGRVIGEVWSTVKVQSLAGHKLLILAPLVDPQSAGLTPLQSRIVAVDTVGAGRGDEVLVALGQAARHAVGKTDAAIEAAIVAIVDDHDEDESLLREDHLSAPKKTAKKGSKKKVAKKPRAKKPRKKETELDSGKEQTLGLFDQAPDGEGEDSSADLRAEDLLPLEPEDAEDLNPAEDMDELEVQGELEEELKVIPDTDADDLPSFDEVDSIWQDDEEDKAS